MACDGLWNSFSNQEATSFINSIFESHNELEKLENQDSIYEICCSRLASKSVRKLVADNITVMILQIKS